MSKSIVVALVIVACSVTCGIAFAQDSTSSNASRPANALPWYQSLEVKGLVETYVAHNFGNPNSRRSSLRLYDIDNESFEPALFALSLRHVATPGRAGFRMDIDAGPHIPEINQARGLEMGKIDLRQAYISYIANFGNGLTIDLGKFVTPCGYELIESPYGISDNATHGYLFNYALPFTHTGIRLTYPISSDLTVAAMGVNGWDNVVDNNESPSAGAQIVWAPGESSALSGSSIAISGIIGPEGLSDAYTRTVLDLAASTSISSLLSIGLGADYGTEQIPPFIEDSNSSTDRVKDHVTWKGIAGFAKFTITHSFALAARAEVFDDLEGVRTGTPQSLHGYTITPIWNVADGFTVKADVRYDVSTANVFESKKGLWPHQTTASLFALFTF
jgi:hypothetical protein